MLQNAYLIANIGFDTAESEPSVGGFIREVLHDVHQIIQHRAPVDRRGVLQLAGEQSPTFVGMAVSSTQEWREPKN